MRVGVCICRTLFLTGWLVGWLVVRRGYGGRRRPATRGPRQADLCRIHSFLTGASNLGGWGGGPESRQFQIAHVRTIGFWTVLGDPKPGCFQSALIRTVQRRCCKTFWVLDCGGQTIPCICGPIPPPHCPYIPKNAPNSQRPSLKLQKLSALHNTWRKC